MTKWPMLPLGEVLQLQRRWVKVDPLATYEEIGVRCFGNGIFHKSPIDGSTLGSKRVLRIEPGDLVFNNVFAWEGAVAVASEAEAGKIGSHRFVTYTVDPSRCTAHYLWWLFKSEPGLELLRRVSPGSAGRNRTMSLDQLPRQQIQLPTLKVQQQLVEYLDALNAKVDAANRLRKEAITLGTAFIASWTANLIGSQHAERVRIGDVSDVRGGIQRTPDRTPSNNPVRYLTVAHVLRDHVRTDDARYFEVRPAELDRWRLAPGDVLIIEGNGSEDQIGRTALFRGEIDPCVHQNHVIRLRPNKSRLYPEFLNLYMNSPLGQDSVQSNSRTTSGLRTLSVGRIKEIPIMLPELVTQHEIVRNVTAFKSKFTEVTSIQHLIERELNAICPSALNEVFVGNRNRDDE